MKDKLLLTAFALCMSLTLCVAQQKAWQTLHYPSVKDLERTFAAPSNDYANHVIWGLQGNVTHDVICRNLDSIRSHGFRNVIIEPGYRMPSKYLSEGYFSMVADIMAEVKARGMKMWIIDEGKYPSGFAGGLFSQLRPDLRMQALTLEGDSVKVAFQTGQTRCVNDSTGAKTTLNSLMDYMNPEATKQFLSWTHEGYKKVLGKEMGRTVLGFRGDEPDYAPLAYTPGLLDTFRVAKGYDPKPYLKSLFGNGGSLEERLFRADYWDVWSKLFANNYFKLETEWCERNGMAHITHLNNDHRMERCVRCSGSLFRCLRQVSIPGVDAIWNQVWPDTINDFPKFASSVAHAWGKPRVFSESFAAYFNTPNLQQAKYVLDYQYARGINFFEFMFWSADTNGEGWWLSQPGMKELNDYANRTSYLLSQGKPGARVAMYYPQSSLWMRDDQIAVRNRKISHLLLRQHYDFDYVDDDALQEGMTMGNGWMENKSGQQYNTLIIPSCDILPEATWNVIKAFKGRGGKVLVWGSQPYLLAKSSYKDSQPFPMDSLGGAWESQDLFTSTVVAAMPRQEISFVNDQKPELNTAPRRGDEPKHEPYDQTQELGYHHRTLPAGEIYFIFNEGNRQQKFYAGLDNVGTVKVYDGYTGNTTALETTVRDNRTWVHLEMKPWESVMLVLEKGTKTYTTANFSGIKGNGTDVDTRALQAAIDTIQAMGGGTLRLTKGRYLTGALFFPQGVNLHLDKGATIVSTENEPDFPVIDTRFEGIEQPWRSALLNFTDNKGVVISGNGTVDGKGVAWKTHNFYPAGRPRLICLTRCDGAHVTGINLRDQASWGLHILYSDSVEIDNLNIVAEHTIPSSDGIDIDSSTRIHVHDCYIEDNDDCISLKAGKDDDGRRVNKPTTDVLVERCRFGYGHSGVDFGSEVTGGISNVLVRNCYMGRGNSGVVRIKSQPSRGGYVRNIHFKDITVDGVGTLLDINMEWRMVPPIAPPAPEPTRLDGIVLENIYGSCLHAGRIKGTENNPVRGIKFIGCKVKTGEPLELMFAEEVDFSGMTWGK
jgi:hypothetical protein